MRNVQLTPTNRRDRDYLRSVGSSLLAISIAVIVVVPGAAFGSVAANPAAACKRIHAQTPTRIGWGTYATRVRGTNCNTANAVLRWMIVHNRILGGGYGHPMPVGKAYRFTCYSQKEAVHDMKFICVYGRRTISSSVVADN